MIITTTAKKTSTTEMAASMEMGTTTATQITHYIKILVIIWYMM